MAQGPSGRIVIEVDPSVKRALYAVLAQEGRTLKEWFLGSAEAYMQTRRQPELLLVAESRATYGRIPSEDDGSAEKEPPK